MIAGTWATPSLTADLRRDRLRSLRASATGAGPAQSARAIATPHGRTTAIVTAGASGSTRTVGRCRGDTSMPGDGEADCTGPGETYWGDGTSCSPTRVQPLPTAPVAIAALPVRSQPKRSAGVYQGDGTNCTTTCVPAHRPVATSRASADHDGSWLLRTYWGTERTAAPTRAPGRPVPARHYR